MVNPCKNMQINDYHTVVPYGQPKVYFSLAGWYHIVLQCHDIFKHFSHLQEQKFWYTVCSELF